ncbi:MAG: hypothetical protein R3E01_20235 [Pirellulaceae bacterium]
MQIIRPPFTRPLGVELRDLKPRLYEFAPAAFALRCLISLSILTIQGNWVTAWQLSVAQAEWKIEDMLRMDEQGQPQYVGMPIAEPFLNQLTADDEQQFQARARHVIQSQGNQKVAAGNTYFENEKRTYGFLMAQVLAGHEDAIEKLQQEDAQAQQWHRETAGIDYYACFTLKHQIRKFFYFGDLLDPSYRQRMFDGGRRWTEIDPLRRPHYAFDKPGEGWGPDVKNSWVDVRSTENLYLMRVSSVYLMAEATGNVTVAEQYKSYIQQYTSALYHIGMGEWDSENYHGHSIAPLCNLYDFSKDPQVTACAKACLDWVFAAGAVKYYRGAFNGPTKRDYNHVQPFGGSAANMLWVHFGDTPRTKDDHWESDEVHLISSQYRPPQAVLNLAHKEFTKPLTIYASKPPYSATTTYDTDAVPEYLETQYIAHSYQLGTLASGTSEDGGDVNGFKLVVYSDDDGAQTMQCVPGPDPGFVGSPMYQHGKTVAANRVAQDQNVAIWLVCDGDAPWTWLIPDDVIVEQQRAVTFLKADRTWIAIHPVNTSPFQLDTTHTEKYCQGDHAKFPRHKVLSARGIGDSYCGLVMEVGERQSHGSYEQFRAATLAAQVDASRLNTGIIRHTRSDGRWLSIGWHDNPRLLKVVRNGRQHDWDEHARYLYRSVIDGQESTEPIHAKWGTGEITVRAGETTYTCHVRDAVPVFGRGPRVGRPR